METPQEVLRNCNLSNVVGGGPKSDYVLLAHDYILEEKETVI